MTQLARYEAARFALAECKAVDEVKDLIDKTAALQAYGRMSQDKTLEVDAAEIRIRAERRLGEMLIQQKAEGGLDQKATLRRGSLEPVPVVVDHDHGEIRPKLSDAGISKDLSSRAQKLASVPEPEFEAELSEHRERISQEGERVTARLEKKAAKPKVFEPVVSAPDDSAPETAELIAQLEELTAENEVLSIVCQDDGLNKAANEIKRLKEVIRLLEARINGLQNERDAAVKQAKRFKGMAEKLEKAHAQ